jgi:hypothetical protein
MQSFVSANGPDFVIANPWIRKFVRNSRNKEWPANLFAYIFPNTARFLLEKNFAFVMAHRPYPK